MKNNNGNTRTGMPGEIEKSVFKELLWKRLKEIVKARAGISARMELCKAIPVKLVVNYNRLCYLLFPTEQDGAEFEKEEAPMDDRQRHGAARDRSCYAQRKAVYKAAIAHFGVENQLYKAVEEMAELAKEIMKSFRPGETTVDKIAEECADTLITLEQLRMIFGINEEVCRWMDRKVGLLAEKLERETGHGGEKM